jgi:hypothetical protein
MEPLKELFTLTLKCFIMVPGHYEEASMSLELATQAPRNKQLLDLIQREFPNYHPLLSIARIAHSVDASLALQFEAHKTVAKYVESELKSVEHKGAIENRHNVRVSLFDPIDGEYTVVEDAMPKSPENQKIGNW